MDNAVEQAYSVWPDRYNVIAKGQPGPAGFRPPEIESAIVKLLGPPATDSDGIHAILSRGPGTRTVTEL